MIRTRRFQLRLTEDEKRRLDEAAHELGMSRAGLVREVVRTVSLSPRLLNQQASEGITKELLRSELDRMKMEVVEKLRELLGGYSLTIAGVSKILEKIGRREIGNREAHRESRSY